MAKVKTTVSIDGFLLEKINDLAKRLDISRSGLLVLAVKEFIQRHENKQLLSKLNKAYDDLPLSDEKQLLHGIRSLHRKLVEGER